MDALKLTFVNGDTVSVVFGVDSSISVETPDGVNGVKRGSWGEITNVEYVKDVSPTVLDPTVSNIPPAEPAAPADPFASAAAAPAAEQQPIEVAVADTNTNIPPITAGASNDASPSLLSKVEDKLGIGTHDQAVTAATAAVDAAPGAPIDHIQGALADVNTALATWPDSTQLQDAKTQLEAQLGTPGA